MFLNFILAIWKLFIVLYYEKMNCNKTELKVSSLGSTGHS